MIRAGSVNWHEILRTAEGRNNASILHRSRLSREREGRHNGIIRRLPCFRDQGPKRTCCVSHFGQLRPNRINHRPLLRQIVLMLRNQFKMLLLLLLAIGLPLRSLKKLSFTELNTFLLLRRHQFLLTLEKSSGVKTLWRSWSALTNSSEGGEGGVSGAFLEEAPPAVYELWAARFPQPEAAFDSAAQIYHHLSLSLSHSLSKK